MTKIKPLNNIFSQFIPSTLIKMPITIVGGLLVLSWLLLTNHTHWSLARKHISNLMLESMYNSLLKSSHNKQMMWSGWLFTSFILILSLNLCSLIPYSFALTSHLSMTFSLAIPLWLSIQIVGVLSNWKSKLSHLVPNGTPVFLIPLMMIIETTSLLIQPMTLGFRLGANLLAGHLLMFLCSCVVWEAIKLGWIGYLSFLLLFLLFILEIAVAFIQASVFLILTKQYLEEKAH